MIIPTSVVRAIHTLSKLHIVAPFIQELSLTEIFKAFLNVYMYRVTLGDENVKQISWLQGYIVVVIAGVAGSVNVALLRGTPIIDILRQTDIWIMYGVLYWMLFYKPLVFDSIHRLFTNYPVARLVLVGLAGINKGYSLIRLGIDKEKELITKFVCGVLVSCGGALWFELFGLGSVQWKFSTPRQFLGPSVGVKASLWTTLCYCIIKSFVEDQEEAHAIGSIIFALLLLYNAHKSTCVQNKINRIKACEKDNKVKSQ